MEQLLFILFLLFSIVSALLERRKRAKQLEEAQQRADERRQKRQDAGEPEPALQDEDDEEEAWGGWPMPGDPFERPRPETQPARRPTAEAAPAQPVTDVRSLLEQIEAQSRAAERRAEEQEQRALRQAEEARRVAQTPPRRVGELMQQRLTQSMTPSRRRKGSRGAHRWRLTPDSARRAVVWSEILGPCKAERGQREERWSS